MHKVGLLPAPNEMHNWFPLNDTPCFSVQHEHASSIAGLEWSSERGQQVQCPCLDDHLPVQIEMQLHYERRVTGDKSRSDVINKDWRGTREYRTSK